MTLEALNTMTPGQFTEAVGWVFEHSPWVAARAAASRPFAEASTLHAAMVHQVEIAAPAEQLALLRAHPDLGTRARLSEASTTEQAGAGLDRLTRAEFDRFTMLNESYKAKFGFPFLFAVKGSTKHDILRALEARLASSREDEFAEALQQVHRIAAFRLADYITGEK
jgi:2-oxo-4-hydroxy-4-carboxy-5-ureidoimidazoline decarboxylase